MKKKLSVLLAAILAFGAVGAGAEETTDVDVTRDLQVSLNNTIRVEAENYTSAKDMAEGEIPLEPLTTAYNYSKVMSFQNGDVLTYKVYIRIPGEYKPAMFAALGDDAASAAIFTSEGQSAVVFPQKTASWDDYVLTDSEYDESVSETPDSRNTLYLTTGVHEITVEMQGSVSFDYFRLDYAGSVAENTLEFENPFAWEIYSVPTGDMFVKGDGSATDQTTYRAYPDGNSSGGYNAGLNASVAEWMADIPESGEYTFKLYYETMAQSICEFSVDGLIVDGGIPVNTTDKWSPSSYDDRSSMILAENVALDKGTHRIKFAINGGATCDCITFEKTGDIQGRTRITRKAETYDLLAGQGEGYFDATSDSISDALPYDKNYFPLELAGINAYRKAIGMESNEKYKEWLKYNVYVSEPGYYRMTAEISRPDSIDMLFDIGGEQFNVTEAANGYSRTWQLYDYIDVGTVYLEKGDNTVKVTNLGSPTNFGGFTLEKTGYELTDKNGNGINAAIDGECTASVDFGKIASESAPTLIAALYTGDKLDNVYFANADADGKAQIKLDAKASQTIKMFVWDSTNGMKPMDLSKETVMRDEEINSIVCWGDSLTAGAGGEGTTYPSVIAEKLADRGIDVYNMGVGGETAYTIAGRQGAIPMTVGAFTIPAGKETVKINFTNNVFPLLQGDQGQSINPCRINGVLGEISYYGSYLWEDGVSQYFFTRLEEGEETEVSENTPVITNASENYTGNTAVIFVGQNGPQNPDELISIQKKMIEKNGTENYLIVGLTSASEIERSILETAMKNTYGDKYLNLREYMSSIDAFRDAGLTPSEDDLDSIMSGIVPQSLRIDGVHFNKVGYRLIGNKIYDKLLELGYIK